MDLFKKMLTSPISEIVLVGTTKDSEEGSDLIVDLTALTGGTSTSPSVNDIVIVYSSADDDGGGDMKSIGWTEIYSGYAEDNNDSQLYVYYKIMGSTPDTSFEIEGSNERLAIAVMVFSGVDTTTPMDVTRTAHTEINTALVDPDAITPITEGAVVVAGGSGGISLSNSDTVFESSDLSSFVSIAKEKSLVDDAMVGMGMYEWESGEFNPAQFTLSNIGDHTSNSNCACTIALRPA